MLGCVNMKPNEHEIQEKKRVHTIEEVADTLGLSKTTVSRAISGKGRVSEQTRDKVLEYMRENDFKPRKHLQKWTDKKTYNICVTLPGEQRFAEMEYFQRILMSIYDFFAIHGYNVFIAKIEPNNIQILKQLVLKHKIDGVILTRSMEKDNAILYLQEKKVPFVVVGSYTDHQVVQVDVNHEEACQELTSILIRMGMKKFAVLCGDLTQNATKNRLLGCRYAFEDNKISLENHNIYKDVVEPIMTDKVIEDIKKKDIECILCLDDNICINVLNKLKQDHIQVPNDIKVASFYNSSLLDEHYPSITCTEFDVNELGVMASKLLLGLLNEEIVPSKVKMGYKVILKESTKM